MIIIRSITRRSTIIIMSFARRWRCRVCVRVCCEERERGPRAECAATRRKDGRIENRTVFQSNNEEREYHYYYCVTDPTRWILDEEVDVI